MNRSNMSWALVLGLVFCTGRSLAARQSAASGAAPQENKTSGQSQTSGTGIVPPGVTLSPQMPSAGAPRTFEFPTAATKTLANGLRVFVVTDHREPAVAANLVMLSAGSVEDPRGAPGVAQLTASLLTQGTAKRTARDIAEGIDFVGGTLSAKAEKDSTTVSLDVVRKDLGTGLDLMSDVVLHPAFLPEEIERQRQQLLSALTVEYSDPDYLATVAFARTVYGDSPYGAPA